MASTDPTALMLQVFEGTDQQRRAVPRAAEERADQQHGTDLQAVKEQAEEYRRANQDKHRAAEKGFVTMMKEMKADRMPATTRSAAKRSPSIKIVFKEFFGEPEDWTTWPRVYVSALRCTDALTETASEKTKVNWDGFDRSHAGPDHR